MGPVVDDSVHLARTLRSLWVARWVAIPAVLVRVMLYDGWTRPEMLAAYGLVAVLLVGNLVTGLQPRLAPDADLRGMARMSVLTDALVLIGFVWLFAEDPTVSVEVALFILPAEAAMVAGLPGALLGGAAAAIALVARFVRLAVTGVEVAAVSVAVQVGVLVVVALIVGQLARNLAIRSAELAAAASHLGQAVAWRGRLIDVLSHDIRSPVGVAQNSLQLLRDHHDQLDPGQRTDVAERGIRQTRRALRLADDLLDLARAGQGRVVLQRQTTDVGQLARLLAEDLPCPAGGDGPAITVVEPQGPVHAAIDPDRTGQILANLISNACKHGRPPVTVTVTKRDDGGADLHVGDAGDGIPSDQLHGLFSPFAHGPRADSVGLGLWIVRLLAQAHSGQVGYADDGHGPTFQVSLPGSPG